MLANTIAPTILFTAAALWQWCASARSLPGVHQPAPPEPELEKAAIKRLKLLGFLHPLMKTMNDFYARAHNGTAEGKSLLKKRMRGRPATRRRAMGVKCIAVDVWLGLLLTLAQHTTESFQAMCDSFRDDPTIEARRWTNEAILRVVFRHGVSTRLWPVAELLWPTCFYGMLTAALAIVGGLLSRSQRRALTILHLRSARLGATFARRILYGSEYRGVGRIFLIDSTQPDAPAVSFSLASLAGFWEDMGPEADDLASRLVQIYRGEVLGIEAHALCEPDVHSRLHSLEVIRSWLLDTAVDGTPRPTRTALLAYTCRGAPRAQPPSHVHEQASACSTVSDWRSSSTTSACWTAATWPSRRFRRMMRPIRAGPTCSRATATATTRARARATARARAMRVSMQTLTGTTWRSDLLLLRRTRCRCQLFR